MAREGFSFRVLADVTGATGALKTLNSGLDKVRVQADKTKGGFASLGPKIAKTAKIAALPMIAFAGTSIHAFEDSEKAGLRLESTLAKMPKLAGENRKSFEDLAKSIQNKTRFDDESVVNAEAFLGQLGLTGKQIKEMLPLIADLASKQGIDLQTATKAVGKAVMGQTKGLQKLGIVLPNTTKLTQEAQKAENEHERDLKKVEDAERSLGDVRAKLSGKTKLSIGERIALRNAEQKLAEAQAKSASSAQKLELATRNAREAGGGYASVVKGLSGTVGGFAAKEGKTFEGRLATMKNKFNDMQEVVGGKLVGAFSFLFDHMNVIGPVIATIVGGIIAFKTVTAIATVVTAIFGETAGAAWLAAAGPIALLVAAVIAVGLVIWKFRDKFVGAFQAIVGFVKRFWPILLPIILGPIGLAIVGFLKHKDKIIGVFRSIVGGIKAAWSGIAGFVGNVFDGVVGAIRTGINVVIHIINGLIRAYNALPFHKDIKTIPTLSGPVKGGQITSLPGGGKAQALASGGIVTRPTFALVGERGPEAIIPLDRATSGGNVTVQIFVQGNARLDDEFANMVRRKFLELRRRTGPLGFA